MSQLEVSLFGTFQVKLEGDLIPHFRSVNTQGLLVYLILQAERPFPRDTLATLFWPDTTDSIAKKNLRQTLYQLRQLLKDSDKNDEPFLLVTRQTVQFNPNSSTVLDVHHFGQALTAGVLETAVSTYVGELLPGFTCDSLDFEEWLRQEREHLHRLALSVMSDLTERQLTNGDYAAAQATARRQLGFEPWRETAHQQLMRGLALAGDRSAALAQYQSCVDMLDEELGVAPSEETEALLARIESGELTAADPNLIAGRYRLGDQIGQGAMGIVYRGLDTETGRIVAIKLLDPSHVADRPELVARFLREGEALCQLNHPNIVELLATYEKDGRYYLVMSYSAGGDLQQRLAADPPLALNEILALALDLADALTRAHRLNILHRDIKPANVLLDADGTPRLTDFGIARLGEETAVTQTGAVMGTTAYMSPEACLGEPLDERTDIWAFGVLLYEMLSGKRPFSHHTAAATMMAILQTPPPDLLALRPDLPLHLVELLDRLLTKNKAARLPSMRHAAAMLEALLHGTELPQLPQPAQDVPFDLKKLRAKLPSLPQPATPFVGRLAETSAIMQTVSKPACRLLTLTGPGGVGKTRLALQVAHALIDQTKQPAIFVSLLNVTHTHQAINLILQALGVTQATAESQMIELIAAQQGVLILDNAEPLLAADGDDFIALLNDIIQLAPQTRLLVTSRQPLNAQQEWVLPIGGLTVPGSVETLRSDQWEQYESISLFRQRAEQAAISTFTLTERNIGDVVQLCRLLHGLPLGIELAAALTRQHSVAEIVDIVQTDPASLQTELRDLETRHRSLFAVFAQSWALLTDPEQQALAKTAVFHHSFTRAAARVILEKDADYLPNLVEKSLLTLHETPRGVTRIRYHLSPLLRSFLLDARQPDNAVRDRHAEYFLEWAIKNQAYLAIEHDNVAAALHWAQSRDSVTMPRRFKPAWLDELAADVAVVAVDERVETAVLVGRDTELDALRHALQPLILQGKNGGLLTITGAAGIGKTHLVAQLRTEESRIAWFDGPCDETSAQAYRPFRI
ncbi:MAG: protein kinase, partial [Anaerolineales bacterium]|nr:protein kinase [Anaerolineales bacterium]